ncbi:MAG: hypothetical protein D6766_08020 [Verrucomicrobia bacterium]|nr:MAG: hypothetical protein D6766_08020 [Verrucomicrobiota bacterium]
MADRDAPRPAGGEAGFTLVEVVLAVGIAAGLLGVVLFFHHQAERFRSGVLTELERLGAVRQVMQRLTVELGCLAPEAGALRGDAAELEFVFAQGGGWARGEAGLRRVRYALPPAEDPEAPPPSLRRTETPVVLDSGSGETAGIETPADAADGVVTFSELLEAGRTNAPIEPGVSVLDGVRRFQLRYWDGSQWAESWAGGEPPLAVEVTLGFDPPAEGETAEDTPEGEVFRRLIPVWVAGEAGMAAAEEGRGGEAAGGGEAEPGFGTGEEEADLGVFGGGFDRGGGDFRARPGRPVTEDDGLGEEPGPGGRRPRRGGFRP